MDKRIATKVYTWVMEARNYNLADYPSVLYHTRYNEIAGATITQEIPAQVLTPAEITFGSPENSVLITRPVTPGIQYPTIPAGKYGYLIQVFRSQMVDGFPGGSNSMGQEMACGFRQGLHMTYISDGGANAISYAPDITRQLTAGTDYVLFNAMRPIGQSCELSAYLLDGTLVHQQLLANSSVGAIEPVVVNGTGTGISGQGNLYQRILYVFDSEQSDILDAIKWHGACAPLGIKGPYPGWRLKT